MALRAGVLSSEPVPARRAAAGVRGRARRAAARARARLPQHAAHARAGGRARRHARTQYQDTAHSVTVRASILLENSVVRPGFTSSPPIIKKQIHFRVL